MYLCKILFIRFSIAGENCIFLLWNAVVESEVKSALTKNWKGQCKSANTYGFFEILSRVFHSLNRNGLFNLMGPYYIIHFNMPCWPFIKPLQCLLDGFTVILAFYFCIAVWKYVHIIKRFRIGGFALNSTSWFVWISCSRMLLLPEITENTTNFWLWFV